MNKAKSAVLVMGILLLASCSSEKSATKSSLRSYTANHIVREIEENSFDFDKLQTKLDIRFKDNNNSLGLKGQLRMQRDSVVWISLSLKVGIEVGRLMITHDSVKFLNRNNKTYMAESLDIFKEKLPFEPTIKSIQDLLVGNDTEITSDERYKVSTDNDEYKLESIKKELLKDVWVTPETFKISRYKIKDSNDEKREIQLEYADFKDVDNKLIPSKVILEMQSDNTMSIEIDYSDIVVDEEVKFPFSISKKFDRIYVW